MGNIVLLDDLTINKIAAGEVIERPASVVKELVENSIDAGATNIHIEIKNGGISYIRITDNGKGIMPDDMEIAFERHATSKIRSADDLETVKSMGFRGEALASIASIARVEMKSKVEMNPNGYQIVVEGGNVISKEEAGCPQGTTITVENLFYNTPVRYKFLKKDFTEAGYIEDVVTRIALVNPHIAIKLISAGKTVIQTPGNGDIKAVIYQIYGKEVADNILDVHYHYEDIQIDGVIGKPSISRSNRANQLFFVNKRYIKDKTLTSAAEQGFKGMITIGKFGFLVLNLQVNPQKVDVNVHPAKLEVRFEEESKVFKAVFHAIKETLLKGDLITQTEKEYIVEDTILPETKVEEVPAIEPTMGLFQRFRNRKEESQPVVKDNVIAQVYQNRNEEPSKIEDKTEEPRKVDTNFDMIMQKMADMKRSVEEQRSYMQEKIENKMPPIIENSIENLPEVEIKKPDEWKENTIVMDTQAVKKEEEEKLENRETQVVDISQILEKEKTQKIDISSIVEAQEEPKDFEQMYSTIFGKKVTQKIEENTEGYLLKEVAPIQGESISVFEDTANLPERPIYKFIGIAFSTYIIIEMDKELYIIDQHAAHERIMYEKVKKNYYSNTEKDSQLMLLPDIITLTHKEMDIAKDNMEMFEKAGFALEEFGENTIKLTGVPNICIDLDTRELFLETLDEINTVARTAKQEIEEKFIATVACKAAVKANMALTKEEVESLMDQLLVLPNPFTCPHGRPTAIKMTKNDIEKKFSRR